MKACDRCIHTRLILSENGYHSICTLSAKAAANCLKNTRDHFVTLHEWDETKRLEPILGPLISKEMEELK